jgi:hypothetical protein
LLKNFATRNFRDDCFIGEGGFELQILDVVRVPRLLDCTSGRMQNMGRCLARRHHGEVPVKKRASSPPWGRQRRDTPARLEALRFSGGSSFTGVAVASLRP